ncbi:MAG: histidinol dehydrogenase [Bacteroidia bacterium]
MIRTYTNPLPAEWPSLLERPAEPPTTIEPLVRDILEQVRKGGDAALRALSLKFDGAAPDSFQVSDAEIMEGNAIDEDLKEAIAIAAENIAAFHAAQAEPPRKIETKPGVVCWRKSLPIERVGLYIPGGTAPLFSTLLMLAIPAKIAGCTEIVCCTPPRKDGSIDPTIRFVAAMIGNMKLFKIGGAQAVAAMAYGTESVPKVDKIFGPGNQYVTLAKQLVQMQGVAIDMPAGPSEVLVIADHRANPDFVAADLLSQAEHGADSQVILVSDSQDLVNAVQQALDWQLEKLPRKQLAAIALGHSKAIVVQDLHTAMAFSNAYAPEHLIIATENAASLAEKVENAGSVFIGDYSCESAGDYASGTNHTLPTNGFARSYSGVSLDSFLKKITFQELSPKGIQAIGPAIERMAAAEQLEAHRLAVTFRLEALRNGND